MTHRVTWGKSPNEGCIECFFYNNFCRLYCVYKWLTNGRSKSPIFSKSFGEQVYHVVRQSILKGDYKPGKKLNEVELSRNLKVSRSPIREALQRLDNEGLVELQPRKGAVVTCLTGEKIEELFEQREALEGMAARFAAQKRG